MATINYKGMELEEFITYTPIAFEKPKKALCWDADDERSFRSVCNVFAVVPYMNPPVLTESRDGRQDSSWYHCALLPDPPKPRRATNRELARWLIEGKAQIRHSDSDMVYVGWNYKEFEDDLPCSNDVLVRKWSDTEWHEPDVQYLGIEDAK